MAIIWAVSIAIAIFVAARLITIIPFMVMSLSSLTANQMRQFMRCAGV